MHQTNLDPMIIEKLSLVFSINSVLNIKNRVCMYFVAHHASTSRAWSLELLVTVWREVNVGCLLAHCRSGEFHQVFTATRLRCRGHHSLLPTSQLHLPHKDTLSRKTPSLNSTVEVMKEPVLTVVDLFGPCQHPVPCSYFINKYLLFSGPDQLPHVLGT